MTQPDEKKNVNAELIERATYTRADENLHLVFFEKKVRLVIGQHFSRRLWVCCFACSTNTQRRSREVRLFVAFFFFGGLGGGGNDVTT